MKNLLNPDYFLINKIPKSHKDLNAVEKNHFLDNSIISLKGTLKRRVLEYMSEDLQNIKHLTFQMFF